MINTNLEKVTKEEFLQEILIVIKDEIIANYEKGDNELFVRLGNGQKFCISIKEI